MQGYLNIFAAAFAIYVAHRVFSHGDIAGAILNGTLAAMNILVVIIINTKTNHV